MFLSYKTATTNRPNMRVLKNLEKISKDLLATLIRFKLKITFRFYYCLFFNKTDKVELTTERTHKSTLAVYLW